MIKESIFSFLKIRKVLIIIFTGIVVIFGILFYLYDIPFDAIIYGCELSFVWSAVCLFIDFYKYYKRHKLLHINREQFFDDAEQLPEHMDIIEYDYQELAKELYQAKQELISKNRIARKELLDYYGMWVHQIKTPIAAMRLTLQNADYETGEVSLEVTAADYDCPMMYYDYSTDGGRTYTELLPWPGLDIMAGTYPDTFTFSVTFTKGEQPVITVRGYNQADLFTESDPVTFAQPFIDQEKAAEEALQESLAAQEAAEASRAAEEQITEAGSSVITMADAAGNTPVPSEKSPEVNFGVLLLLLLVFLLYQIQQGRRRKRRRKNQSRKVSGDNRNHPR